MEHSDLIITLVSCAFFMALVAIISYYKTKGTVSDKDGYFLAGKSLSGIFIAGSLLLTNLSAEQLVGLNGQAYRFNMTSMAWEVTAGAAVLIMALVFLPRYLQGAFTTLPEFLNNRFDDQVRRYTVILFMLGYSLITIPSILYSGSVAVLKLFDVPNLFGIGYMESLIYTILTVGIVGSIYAVFGGLKAVAVSDTLNGVGLLIIGILIPILGFIALGEGNFINGVTTLMTEHTEKLDSIGGPDDPIPFATIFTGMIFANLFYWGTNQYVIQRTLGAANLAEGQKGVIFSGYYKVLVPLMMMIPGTIAYHLYGDSLIDMDLAFPTIVTNLLPVYLSGFFLAVLLGAVFSSFNSLLNSAATMFVLDIYEPIAKKELTSERLVYIAKIASVIIALFSFVISPLLFYAPQGLWEIIRVFTGFYSIPIIAIVLVGLFTKRVPPLAAKVAIIFHVIVYGLALFVFKWDIHYVHLYGVLFYSNIVLMLIIGRLYPQDPYVFKATKKSVDMTPWKYAIPSSLTLLTMIIILFIIFSPLGLVNGLGTYFWPVIIGLIILNIVLCFLSMYNKLYLKMKIE